MTSGSERKIAGVEVAAGSAQREVASTERDDRVIRHAAGSGQRAKAGDGAVIDKRPVAAERAARQRDFATLDIDAASVARDGRA